MCNTDIQYVHNTKEVSPFEQGFRSFVFDEGALLDGFGATIGNALSLQLAASTVGLVFCALAITLIKTTFWLFCIVFGVGFCSLMAATAPLCE